MAGPNGSWYQEVLGLVRYAHTHKKRISKKLCHNTHNQIVAKSQIS
jgi:hypothetical protein